MADQYEEESPEKPQAMPQAEQHPLDQQQYEQQYNDQQDYGDQQQYGEEDDGEYPYHEEVTGALVATRQNKKKAQDDAKLLANRIALLKLEEKKAWKKIEETKKKAEQVVKIRARNDDDRSKKLQLQQQREEEEQNRLEQNARQRDATRQNIMAQNQNKQMTQINEANNLKEERAKNERIIKMQKEQELMKNNNIKEMIRQQKMMAEERKEMEYQEKRLQQRNKLINSILEENNLRMEIESKVAELEKEEYNLIQKLQNTSSIQKQAYEELETALNGEVSPEQLEKQFALGNGKKSNGKTRVAASRK